MTFLMMRRSNYDELLGYWKDNIWVNLKAIAMLSEDEENEEYTIVHLVNGEKFLVEKTMKDILDDFDRK